MGSACGSHIDAHGSTAKDQEAEARATLKREARLRWGDGIINSDCAKGISLGICEI